MQFFEFFFFAFLAEKALFPNEIVSFKIRNLSNIVNYFILKYSLVFELSRMTIFKILNFKI
jgi:hypothetical protein